MIKQSTAQGARPATRLAWLTPGRALAGLIGLFSLAVIGAASFKYAMWGQGFDMVDFHMPIWGTLHGKFLLVSRYNFTDTFMGLDVALGFLPALPFYALLPSAYTLVALQVLLLASAAVPVYLIARARFASAWAGVAWAAVYLLYPTTQFMAMAGPFQPRVPGLVAFFWAFYFLQQRRLWPYLVALAVAMLSRSDAALVVVAFGLYAGLGMISWGRLGRGHGDTGTRGHGDTGARPTTDDRRPTTDPRVQRAASLRMATAPQPPTPNPQPPTPAWLFTILPLVLGLVYFYVAITYITPRFYAPSFQPTKVELAFNLNRDYNTIWPCGMSPQACYYLHLGGSLGGIATNILTHPVEVFFFIFQPEKLRYLALMLGALLFMPLLAPRELLLAAPIFAINLLSNRIYQYTITEQYQILTIPGLLIAAIYGGAWLWERLKKQMAGAASWSACVALVGLVALLNIPLKNPVISALRNHEEPGRVALMERMSAIIPPDAVVAATSFLAPHLLPRTELYYIPGGPMHHQIDEAEYAFIDTRASGLRAQAAQGNDIVARLRADPRWSVIAEEDGLVLFRRLPTS